MDSKQLQEFAAEHVAYALQNIRITDNDQQVLDRLADLASGKRDVSFFKLAVQNNVPLTSGVWSFYMRLLVQRWTDREKDVAIVLPTFRRLYPGEGKGREADLLDKAADTLNALAWLALEPANEAARPEQVLTVFYKLARSTEGFGDSDTAYNLVALALDLGAKHGETREEVARYALSLAITADRMHQIAVCHAQLAAAVAYSADKDIERRLEAFDCCEAALQRLAMTPEPFREMAATTLADVVGTREYLRSLLLPLAYFLPSEELPLQIQDILKSSPWPERVSTQPRRDWINFSLPTVLKAQSWDVELERARLELELLPAENAAHIDWTNWTIDHASYRRAIPQHRSFLREADFERNLLILTHEITHALSLVGGIGSALTSLRVAAIASEFSLWALAPSADGASMEQQMVQEVVAPLESGDSRALIWAEQGVEVILKSIILQDIWTPWLEGLAVFGEIAADPSLDPRGIGHVTNCVRNLIDFHPANDGSKAPPDETRAELFDEFVAEFDKHCSAAINHLGPIRLGNYFRAINSPYFSGFLAIHSVVSAWRSTTGRPITGTEAFNLLLHATRHGTFQAIPDLSLRSDLFMSAAIKSMSNWAGQLARLTRDEIEEFLAPPQRDGPGRTYRWRGPRLARVTAEDGDPSDQQSAEVARRVLEAFSSLSRHEDDERINLEDPLALTLLTKGKDSINGRAIELAKESTRWVETQMTLSSLLPIGHTAAPFFINIDEQSPDSFLGMLIRTTEAHASDGNPSMNGLWLHVDHASGRLIAEAFRRDGKPRLHITRLIDLGGILLPEWAYPGHHVLAFSYGDWFWLHGATPAVDALLSKEAHHLEGVLSLVRQRLQPDLLTRALERISQGRRSAERTFHWVTQSNKWTINGQPTSVGHWVERVRALAERCLTEDERRLRQIDAARSLFSTLLQDDEQAEALATRDFETLTECAPERRGALVHAIFKMAQRPSSDAETTAAVAAFSAGDLKIFNQNSHGWDVRAAINLEPKEGIS